MKRLLLFIPALFICTVAIAHTINWHVDGDIYQTTTCDSGDSITPPTTPIKYGYHFVRWKPLITLEYLESTGTQYINTGITGTLNTAYEIIVQGTTFNTFNLIFGARNSATEADVATMFNNNSIVNDFGDYSKTRQQKSFNSTDIYHKFTVTNSKSNRTIYDWTTDTIYTNTNTYSESFTTRSKLYIGYCGAAAGLNSCQNFKGYIFGCKIWDNGTLVRDFIPVLDVNGTPCMYDKVEGKFYYNAGTGQFIAGPVIGAE